MKKMNNQKLPKKPFLGGATTISMFLAISGSSLPIERDYWFFLEPFSRKIDFKDEIDG
ncbi:hypothetical protein HYC85_023625 [Camellia sinensis]|uniref:Uncharacterized protein n=1 Tax=Camellia sinensis TaxID=4442 RepID=A0A7J7GIZ0_CAMSI|nr:hypothetical protein HYC85_023625 [Camellia sinensis]